MCSDIINIWSENFLKSISSKKKKGPWNFGVDCTAWTFKRMVFILLTSLYQYLTYFYLSKYCHRVWIFGSVANKISLAGCDLQSRSSSSCEKRQKGSAPAKFMNVGRKVLCCLQAFLFLPFRCYVFIVCECCKYEKETGEDVCPTDSHY